MLINLYFNRHACVCVCVSESNREKERESRREKNVYAFV